MIFQGGILLLVLFAGCQSGQIFYAKSLPPELMAPRQISISSVDLTRIARSVGDSEVLYSGDVIEVTITTGLEERAPEATMVLKAIPSAPSNRILYSSLEANSNVQYMINYFLQK